MQRVLIIGGSGFIGRALFSRLSGMGLELVAVADVDTGFDIRESSVVDKAFQHESIDTVFNLAAITTTQQAAADPKNCYAVNVAGMSNVLDAALKFGIKRVVVPVTYLLPTEPYSISKHFAYELTKLHTYKNVSVVSHCNVYGPGDYNVTRIIPSVINKVLKGENPVVQLDAQREFIYIDDIVECYIRSATGEFGDYIQARGTLIDLWDLASMIVERINPNQHIQLLKGNDKKAVSLIDPQRPQWRGTTSINDGLEKTIQWYKAHYDTAR